MYMHAHYTHMLVDPMASLRRHRSSAGLCSIYARVMLSLLRFNDSPTIVDGPIPISTVVVCFN